MALKKFSLPSNTVATIILLALLIAFSSEIKLMPFEDFPFRFGLGSMIFFLAVLIQPIPIIKFGFVTGITVVIFRVFLDLLVTDYEFSQILIERFPAALFYFFFAFFLSKLNIEKYKSKPIALGLFATLFEFVSNFIEELFILLFVVTHTHLLKESFLLLIVAFIRSFSVVGIYSAIIIGEQKRQFQQLLSIGSNLYVETLYLKKSMDHIEQITASSFELYKALKPIDNHLSTKALFISQEIHEVKKDSQRIYSGLSKITTAKNLDDHLISNLLQYVIEANKKYSTYLNKSIEFKETYHTDFYTKEPIALLALLNNLVSNAVEAIEEEGSISISVNKQNDETVIEVEDTGVGIPKTMLPVIFDAGYTTKFNDEGKASTGIGLSHVQSIVEKFEGKIVVESNQTTKFTITIPTNNL